MNKQLTTIVLSRYFVQISFILLIIVIPLGFEPKIDMQAILHTFYHNYVILICNHPMQRCTWQLLTIRRSNEIHLL